MQNRILDAHVRELISAIIIDRFYLDTIDPPADERQEVLMSIQNRMRMVRTLTNDDALRIVP